MTLAELKTLIETHMRETGNGSKEVRFHVIGGSFMNSHCFDGMFASQMSNQVVIAIKPDN